MLSRQYIYWGNRDLLRGLAGRRSEALSPEPVGVSSSEGDSRTISYPEQLQLKNRREAAGLTN